jgi:hypothetical protein
MVLHSGRHQCFIQILDWKGLPAEKHSSLFNLIFSGKEKQFRKLITGVTFIFFIGTDEEAQKAILCVTHKPGLIFAGKARNLPMGGVPEWYSTLADSSGPFKYWFRLEKHSSLFSLFICKEEEQFRNLITGVTFIFLSWALSKKPKKLECLSLASLV